MDFDEIMNFNVPYNAKNFNKLVEAIKTQRIVPYIGAGMSMLFKDAYPSWGGVLDGACKEYLLQETEQREYMRLKSYEEKADYLYEQIGRTEFSQYLKEVFGLIHLQKEKEEFIGKAAYVVPLIFDNGLIITTNYDRVIEKTFSLHGKVIPVAHPGHYEALNNSLINRQLLLYKIHGDINEPETSIVLTTEKYNKVYADGPLVELLCRVYSNNQLLFLGCSLEQDRPLKLLERVSEAGMIYYGILPCNKDKIKERRLELDNRYRIQGIFYPENHHDCVRIILDRILQILKPKEYEIFKENSKVKTVKKDICELLTDQWFINQNDIQIKNLGNRYLPDLNIELELSNMFNALGKDEMFKQRFKEKTERVIQAIEGAEIKNIQREKEYIQYILDNFDDVMSTWLEIDKLIQYLEIIKGKINEQIREYNEIARFSDEAQKMSVKERLYELNNVDDLLYEYESYIDSSEVQLANTPYMLLYGVGGIGKSHILANTIREREEQGYKSLLFLGQQFKTNKTPIKQMLEQLQLECTFEELLDSLNKIGEEKRQRIIIFIDALNEGEGKQIWKDYLAGIVEMIKQYKWLGLVVSIRTEYRQALISNNNTLRTDLISVEHVGFSTIEYQAVEEYFHFYGISYADVPMSNEEFSNPLFLRLTCEAFNGKEIHLDSISFTDIYRNYLCAINNKISEVCGYSKYINMVELILCEIVKFKYDSNRGNNLIPIDKCTRIILNLAKGYNISSSIIDELLASGIINKTIDTSGRECIHITYEKLEDFLYSTILIEQLGQIGKFEFANKYSGLLANNDILETFAIVLSEEDMMGKKNAELFEIFTAESDSIIRAFISALKWRKSSTITKETFKYINDQITNKSTYILTFYDALIQVSTKVNHCLNADCTVKHILQGKMPDRDARFIPIFDCIYNKDESSINRLLKWCFEVKNYQNVSDERVRLAAIMVSTFLLSSNRKLRDESTKALVCLLTGKIDIVISVLNYFSDVDDPYISERLYAVAFGTVVSEKSDDMVEKIALYVYNTIFNRKYVYPNILLRDYAKNIVEYGKYRTRSKKLMNLNVSPPYQSIFPDIPSDLEIEKYYYDYKDKEFKDYYWSQNAILSSMQVEYTRKGEPGCYGDFGRYIFQSYFYDWIGIDFNDLKNIAIKRIFDMGYNVEKHGHFDRKVPCGRSTEKINERIGKKYQWIALFELAAQVADNYKIEVHTDCYGGTQESYCLGSFEPDIRDIDPTIYRKIEEADMNNKIIHGRLFTFDTVSNMKWLENFDDLPDINSMTSVVYKEKEYILLNGWYHWKESKRENSKNAKRGLWAQINSYIVRNEDVQSLVKELTGKDFHGRWLKEPNHNYTLFNKEYYWSKGYNFFKNPYYCGEEWADIDEHGNRLSKKFEVLLPTFEYRTERSSDNFYGESTNSWHKPCGDLFDKLHMKYGQENSVLYDSNGEVVCFESSELLGEDIGFFIRKDSLIQYLEMQGYNIVWTLLAEKEINHSNNRESYCNSSISGVYQINSQEKLEGSTVENTEGIQYAK